MSLFKQVQEIKIETPDSIDFENKRFHLSGNFSIPKKDFGTKLEEAGATFSGIKGDSNHQPHLTLRDTDYFVLADSGITHAGEKKDHGNKAKKVQAHNDKPNQSQHIPIITESHCKKLLDEFALRKTPKP
jgi:hypothetical protein